MIASVEGMTDAESFLESAEADNRALIYQCRWDVDVAAEVVPKLVACLEATDADLLRRSLSALSCIGLPAAEATTSVIALIWHSNDIVARTATHALAAVGRKRPAEVVPALIAASKQDHLQKDAMFGLIAIGKDAQEASGVFTAALSSADNRMRRLALRGLEAVATQEDLRAKLEVARTDRSKAVRDYAHKIELRTIEIKQADQGGRSIPPAGAR